MKSWNSGDVRRAAGRRIVMPLLSAALLLTACGTGGGAGGQVSGAGANLPGTPIVIGGLVNVSGSGNDVDKVLAPIMKAWGEHTNKNGGIKGHPVDVRVEDTRNDASQATALAEQLVADDSVVAVAMGSTAIEGAISPVFAGGDVAVGGIGYNPKVWSALPNYYTITTTFPQTVSVQLKSAKDIGATKVAAVACAESVNCLAAAPVFEAATKTYGLGYAGVFQVSSSAPNYTAECLQMIQKGVDYIQISISQGGATRLVTDCQRQGYKGWFGASHGSVQAGFYSAVPTIRMAGGINGFPWWTDTEPVKAFRAAMQEAGLGQEEWANPNSTAMWASLELLRKALSGVAPNDQVTRKTVQQGLGGLRGETLDGLLPMPITYTPGQPAPKVPCYWLYRYENAKFSGPEQPTCETTTS